MQTAIQITYTIENKTIQTTRDRVQRQGERNQNARKIYLKTQFFFLLASVQIAWPIFLVHLSLENAEQFIYRKFCTNFNVSFFFFFSISPSCELGGALVFLSVFGICVFIGSHGFALTSALFKIISIGSLFADKIRHPFRVFISLLRSLSIQREQYSRPE